MAKRTATDQSDPFGGVAPSLAAGPAACPCPIVGRSSTSRRWKAIGALDNSRGGCAVTRVTIVGAGNMGRGIGTRAVAGGHQVEIVDRDPAEAQQLAKDLGGSAAALDPEEPFG